MANVNDLPPVLRKLKKPETLRTYHYPDGTTAQFNNVTAVYCSERTGSHRLEFGANGEKKAIVLAGFTHITLQGADWEF